MSAQKRACARCGIPCAIGSNTREYVVCRDCRVSDKAWLRMVGGQPKTEYREECGTVVGLKLHAENGEPECGQCLAGDDARRLAHEARQPIPAHPSTLHPQQADDLYELIHVLDKALREAS